MVLRKCSICDRKFKKTEHYKRHERSHTNERPYECSVCHKKFSRRDVLTRHAKNHVKDQNNVSFPESTNDQFAGRRVIAPPSGLSSNLDYLAGVSAHLRGTEPGVNAVPIDEQPPSDFGWGDVAALDSTGTQQSERPATTLDQMSNDVLQLWLEPRADTLSGHSSSVDFIRATVNAMGESFISPDRHSGRARNIPNERFARVERCWLIPADNVGRLMNSLWKHTACYDADNIFSVPATWQSTPLSTSNYYPGSRFGLDEECRLQLQHSFGLSPAFLASLDCNDDGLLPSSSSSSIPSFPPAEVLDMALDLYFRHFHPLVPFVHIPTFCAKRTRLPLLFVMCQIGMIILGTNGTTTFVLKTFTYSLEKISTDLAKCAIGNETPAGIVSIFAAAFLMLNLATMTGEKLHLQQSQMLYINLMSIAQRHGLFAADEGQSVEMSLFEAVPDLEMRWKAWSRVESVKRLIVGLILLDSWFSSFLSVSPLIVPDSVQFALPCHESLFQANSSSQWMQFIRDGKRIITPMVKSPSEASTLPVLDMQVHELSMQGLLAMLQLRLSEAYHRLLSKRPTKNYLFAPCHTYAMDGRARCLITLQVQLMDTYSEFLQQRMMNPNCIITWHRMCMDLTADPQIFDLGAGRNGPGCGRQALDDIAAWSQTPAARRACLHAAHIFKALSNRKASDDVLFCSAHALFSAALVLGLYIFMAPETTPTQAGASSIELMGDNIDWKQIGMEGFTASTTTRSMEQKPEEEGDKSSSAVNDQAAAAAAIDFIRNGGAIYIRGVLHQSGYQSARRILLDYGNLLKDTGKWSVRKMSYVLDIMSDVLMEVD